MKKKKSILITICFISSVLSFNLLLISEENNKIKSERKNCLQCSAISTLTFSQNLGNPTDINVDTLYNDLNTHFSGNYYIRIYLESGNIYYIEDLGFSWGMVLYNNSLFSEEIKASVNEFIYDGWERICFAPSISKYYYIKWKVEGIIDRRIGVWKADYYRAEDVLNGVLLEKKDNDFDHSVFCFQMPDTSSCENESEIIIISPPLIEPFFQSCWIQIDLNSGQAFSKNEIHFGSNDLLENLFNNSFKVFFICIQSEGLFKISFSNGTFHIIDPSFLSLWQIGSTQLISWLGLEDKPIVQIDLYKEGVFNYTINPCTENDGSYSWTIPIFLQPSSGYSIRINASDYICESEMFVISSPFQNANDSIPGYSTLILIISVAIFLIAKFKKRELKLSR